MSCRLLVSDVLFHFSLQRHTLALQLLLMDHTCNCKSIFPLSDNGKVFTAAATLSPLPLSFSFLWGYDFQKDQPKQNKAN